MNTQEAHSDKFRVLIAGGGVAAIETALALTHFAADHVQMTVLAPNDEFVYRPMTVGEPFSFAGARRYPLAPIAKDVAAELIPGALQWVDHERSVAHTEDGQELPY
ncbi:MAG TPA: hypothetical protein VHY83_14750, partial [Solirubrobacteraceae bacterium]|nr:hypothetical protein [Solirubrobacteraceae bacterium]